MESTTTTPNSGDQRKNTAAVYGDKVKMGLSSMAADGGEMASPFEKRGGKKEGGSSSMRICQADKCAADLSDAKQYHRRHKVCEVHAKSQAVVVAGNRQRFCQQCSRFHELSEFDDTKRSCRRRLAGHNERRRKSASDSNNSQVGEGNSSSNSRLKGTSGCSQVDERGRIKINIQANAAYKHFQIR